MTIFPHASLARWFGRHKRSLPWRQNPTPYRVWISEIMLQQTRVDAVIPYYLKFMKCFPTLRSLARAPEASVLARWTGLGYYSRARNLHKTAKILARGGSRFPAEPSELIKLPGVGPYTAGAVASIAFDVPAPIYDGNVRRVLSRFYLSRDDKALQKKSAEIVMQAHRAGVPASVFNQALMELGALVCLPRNPACGSCPVGNACGAARKGVQALYPERLKAALVVKQFHALAVLTPPSGAKKFLVVRRPAAERWLKDLWEFPMTTLPDAPGSRPLEDLSKAFETSLKTPVSLRKNIGKFRHSITHHDLRVFVFLGQADKAPPSAKWVGRADMERLSASSMLSKSLALLPKIL